MAKQLGDLLEATLAADDFLVLVRNSSGVDQKIEFKNFIKGRYTTQTGNYTVADDIDIVLVNNTVAVTITLPAAATNSGRIITIKKIIDNTFKVTIDGNASETIDGEETIEYDDLSAIKMISDGSNWHVI